jgi:hypothetical protein
LKHQEFYQEVFLIKAKSILAFLFIIFFAGMFGVGLGKNDSGRQKIDGYEDYHPFKSPEAKEKFLKVY